MLLIFYLIIFAKYIYFISVTPSELFLLTNRYWLIHLGGDSLIQQIFITEFYYFRPISPWKLWDPQTSQPVNGAWTNNPLMQRPHQRFNCFNQSGLFILKRSFFWSTKKSMKENLKLSFKWRVTSYYPNLAKARHSPFPHLPPPPRAD